MTISPHMARALPAFSVTFAVVYLLATELNWALLTYHPITGRWGLGVQAAAAPRQPAMYWYGWLLTASIAALCAGGLAAALPQVAASRLWAKLVWAVPMVCMVAVLYMLRGYFLR